MPKLIVNCSNCNKILYKQPRDKRNKNHFCNIKCKNEWQKFRKLSKETKRKISIKSSGKNNPMYGKSHSKDTKKNISEKKIEYYKNNPDKKFQIGNSRLSKEEKFQIIQKGHLKRNNNTYSHPHSNESKKLIGIKSKEKFTFEFKKNIREKNEASGLWIPLDQKDNYVFYKELSGWKKRMWDLVKDEKQILLLRSAGIFHPGKNNNGVVRDHKYSRYSGWKNFVFPEILRHPFNCEIILHSDNVKKSKGWKHDENSIKLKDLFSGINNYKYFWPEQDICLKLIEDYNKGERYNRNLYYKKYYDYD